MTVDNRISYTEGYEYQLYSEYSVKISICPLEAISTDYICLDTEGNLFLHKGYAWDGPSGPTVDTKNFMRGSLVHDALYQLMREKYLDHDTYRDDADEVLKQICKEDGMSSIRAWYVFHAVRWFGSDAADPLNDKLVLTAP